MKISLKNAEIYHHTFIMPYRTQNISQLLQRYSNHMVFWSRPNEAKKNLPLNACISHWRSYWEKTKMFSIQLLTIKALEEKDLDDSFNKSLSFSLSSSYLVFLIISSKWQSDGKINIRVMWKSFLYVKRSIRAIYRRAWPYVKLINYKVKPLF